jgi:hypothetical protein
VSADGLVVTQKRDDPSLVHLTTKESGMHYWEVEIMSYAPFATDATFDTFHVGVCRPNLELRAFHGWCEDMSHDSDGAWLQGDHGRLFGNGKYEEELNTRNSYRVGDRIGILMDFSDGSLLYFKNGGQNGPGWPAGSINEPVALAIQMAHPGHSVRYCGHVLVNSKRF